MKSDKEPSALVLVTTSFPINGNGSEAAGSFVADLAEELGRSIPIRVVAPGISNTIERWNARVTVYRFASPPKPLSTLKLWHPVDLIVALRVMNAGAEATQAAVLAGPTAHILALWALPSGHWARKAARKAGVPYSVWTLGSDIWSLGRIPVVRSYLATILRQARTCFSDGLQLMRDTRKIAKREVSFLPSTRTLDRVRSTPLKSTGPYRLLFLGRWHSNKGIDLLLQTINLLDESDWSYISAIEICGGGPLEAQVRSGVTELQARQRPVQLRGFIDKDEAEKTILMSDFVLIPSRIESIPVVFSDAIKLGCPVVAMPVGDLLELTERNVGVCADKVTAQAFAEALAKALRVGPQSFDEGLRALSPMFSNREFVAPEIMRLLEVEYR